MMTVVLVIMIVDNGDIDDHDDNEDEDGSDEEDGVDIEDDNNDKGDVEDGDLCMMMMCTAFVCSANRSLLPKFTFLCMCATKNEHFCICLSVCYVLSLLYTLPSR